MTADIWAPFFFEQGMLYESLSPLAKKFQHYREWPGINDFICILQDELKSIQINNRHPLLPVPQDTIKPELFEDRYESTIFLKGELQTRLHNWHDFFNLLAWTTFPSTKVTLNKLQYHYQYARHQKQSNVRTQIENTLTHFDESGVIIVSSNLEYTSLLKGHDWFTLFYANRSSLFNQMDFVIFGHGLYERCLSPFVGVTGKGLIIHAEQDYFELDKAARVKWLDCQLASTIVNLPTNKPAKQLLQPLPILGIPGWHSGHQTEKFYKNQAYFRPLNLAGG